jgi:hypothetical protein
MATSLFQLGFGHVNLSALVSVEADTVHSHHGDTVVSVSVFD